MIHNTGGIGFVSDERSKQTLKMEKLKKLLLDHKFDLVGLTEVNKDWRRMEHNNTIWGATSGWRENRRVQVGQNITKPSSKSDLLIGGVAMVAFDDLVFRISKQESDARNLGRWCSFTITGKNNVKTSIFTCYCPVRGKSIGSTLAQHLIYMKENKSSIPDTHCPRQLFGLDLKAALEDKMEKGHNILVMGDFNSEHSNLKKWMQELGLSDLIEQRHGTCPKTYIRSKDSPIDCIFGSPQFTITRGGYLSFTKLLSNHRGIWVDIPKFLLYGYNPPQPTFPSARRLKLLDPRVVKKYIDRLLLLMHKHDLFYRMNILHNYADIHFSERRAEEFEKIDKIVGKLMNEAESKCRKLHTGAVPWSPTYKKACDTLLYWLMRRTYFNGEHRNVRQLIVLQRKIDLQYDPTLSLNQIDHSIKEAYKERKRCMKLAESLSLEYRTQLAIAKEEAGETKAASFLRNMNHIEAQRRLFRNIRHMEGKTRGGSTSKVITTFNNIPTEYTDKTKIEQLCANENERKYHRFESSNSQLFLPELIQDLGRYGEGPQVKSVIDGTYVPPNNITHATRDFLSACNCNSDTTHIDNEQDIVSRYNSHVSTWKIRKEFTGTYHHHIGHYKAVLKNKDLSWFFFQRSDIPEITGYSPIRHRECVDLMIMKRSQCFELTSQRTLGILDTEFNQSNKKIGKMGMDNAIDRQKLAPEQFAVRNSSAIDQIVSKRCIIDHHHSKRRCFTLTSSDLDGCYDRIIHTAAALALLRVGIPINRIKSMFSSIQRMIHKIRTTYGDSEITYGGDDLGAFSHYPQGVLQGNATGPTVWILLSSVVFEILHKRGFAVEMCTSISKQLFQMVGFAYVDDCDLFQSGNDPIEVHASTQDLLVSWSSIMDVTGGAISIDKSWWYLIDYIWNNGKWIAQDAGTDLELLAPTPTGDSVSLNRLYADEASEMLGVWVAPNGNKDKLITNQRDAAITWGAKVKVGHPSQMEAWQALHSTITAKLKYPLPACSLTEAECKSIMYPTIKAALPKAGIASNMVCAVRDAPFAYGGAGVLSLYHQQGTARTTMIVEQLFKMTPTGKQLLTCIEDLVLEAGLYGPLWEMPFKEISKYVDKHSLIYDTLQYQHENNIAISAPHGTISPQRDGDSALMDLALTKYNDCATLRAIQRVRMAFGVIHLSDICSVNGSTLNMHFLKSQPTRIIKNTYDWPSKHHFNRYDLSKWRNLLRDIFCDNNHNLPTPLGIWKHMSQSVWIDSWDFFITNDKEFLFHFTGGVWRRHLLRPHSNRSYHLEYLETDRPSHLQLLRATVQLTKHCIFVISTSHRTPPNITPPQDMLTFGSISIEPPSISWFMDNISSSNTTDHLLTHLLQGTAIAVSDGSYFPLHKVGACAWIVSTPDGSEFITGGGLIPGESNDQSSYRSELGGLLGIVGFISHLLLPPSLSPTITIACDGLNALNNVHSDKSKLKAKYNDIDLISIINSLWNKTTFIPKRVHVYGHQDSKNRTLTILEQLNCLMDTKAKAIATTHIDCNTTIPPFAATSLGYGTIKCGSKLITSNLQSSLYNQITLNNMIEWFSTNSEVKVNLTQSKLAWHCFSQARKEVSLPMNLFITKWLSGDTATGRVMCQRKQRCSSSCPRCGEDDEHLLHVLTCNSTETTTLQHKLLSELVEWLRSNNTHPRLALFFKLGLKKWFDDQTYQWHPSSAIFSDSTTINTALHSQLQVTWYFLLCGLLTEDIVSLQQSYFNDIDSKKSSSRWATNLIKKLWNIPHQLWLQRNEALHKKESIYKQSKLQILKTSITNEYNYGLANLPQIYSSYFNQPLRVLLKKSTHSLKRWFLIIRSAREAEDSDSPQDIFSVNGPMRSWIKLSETS